MKKLIIFLLVLTAAGVVKAQTKNSDSLKKVPTNYFISSSIAAIRLFAIVDTNTRFVDFGSQLPNQPLTSYIFLKGTKKVGLVIPSGMDNSYKNYRYNIIQDDSIFLASNAEITDSKYGIVSGFKNQLELGWFDVANKMLVVEIFDIRQRNKVSTTTIYNKPFNPAKILQTSLCVTSAKGSGVEIENLKDNFKLKIDDGHRRVTAIQLAIAHTDATFVHHVFIRNMTTGKLSPVSNNWYYNYLIIDGKMTPHLEIDNSFFSNPGNYQIVVAPQLPSHVKGNLFDGKATILRFTVLPSDTKYSGKAVLYIALGIIFLAAIAIFFIRRHSQKKLIAQQKEKDMAEVQLSAVRSQLNPHFLFNALAGIQNLMNKNQVDQANRYLAKFARLTRNVLNSKDRINIADEVNVLNDYLQMEQLRFGFKYEISVANDLDADNTEIPAMLIQPFVENAVKHGIAAMGDKGKIDVRIFKEQSNLLLVIADNGNGFDSTKPSEGLGIALSKRRIDLLNKIYTQVSVQLNVESTPEGSEIKITLTQWL